MGTVTVTLETLAGNAVAGASYSIGSKLLLGSSNIDGPADLSAYESRYGPLKLRRSYDQPATDLPSSWAASAAGMDANKRGSVWSFKTNISATASGSRDARMDAFLATIPVDGRMKYLIMQHEPEGEIKSGQFTASDYKAAQNRWNNRVKATGRLDLLAMVCFAGTQTFDGQTAFTADDLCPPGMAACFDAYNKWPESGFQWKELSERAGLQVQWAKASGRKWGISETACYEWTDGPQRKLDWTNNAVNWVQSQGGLFLTYWDKNFGSDPDPVKRRLHSSTQHISLWKNLTAAS